MTSTRARIVTATTELFRRQGFHGTSLKDVAAGSGAPTGSIYHFFPGGKTELAEASLLESGAAYQQLFELIADEAGDPVEAVTAFFDGAADVLEQTDFIDICPIGTVAREIASTDDTLRLATATVFAAWIDAAAARFRAAGLDPDEARDLAVTVVAALEGSFGLARAARDATAVRTTGRHLSRHVARCLESPAAATRTGRRRAR